MNSNRAIGLLTILNITGAVLSIIYTIMLAYYFGVSRELEIFFAAQTLIMSINSLTQTGHISAIFFPYYHKLKREFGVETSQQSFSIILNWLAVFSLVITGICFLLNDVIIEVLMPGFSPSDRVLGVEIFSSLILIFPLMVVNSIFNIPFNAEKWYGVQEVISLSNRVFYIIILFLFFEEYGIWANVIAFWVGTFIKTFAYLSYLFNKGFKFSLKFESAEFSPWPIFLKITNSFTYAGATQIYVIALTSAATFLPQGYYAVYRYVVQIYAKTDSILIKPISTVFYTDYNENIQKIETSKRIIRSSIEKIQLVYFIILFNIILSGKYVLGFLWGNEKFGASYIESAHALLIVYFVVLIFPAVNQILSKVILSTGEVRKLYFSWSLSQLLSSGVAYLTIPYLGFDGLLVVISFNLFSQFLVSFVLVEKKIVEVSLTQILKWIVILIPVIIATYFTNDLYRFISQFSEGKIANVLMGFINAIVIGVLVFTIGPILKINSIRKILEKVKSKC